MAVQTFSAMKITYEDRYGRVTERVIEPKEIFQGENGYFYFRAFCHLRGEERYFRLDRIIAWEKTDATAWQVSREISENVPVEISNLNPDFNDYIVRPGEVSVELSEKEEVFQNLKPTGEQRKKHRRIFAKTISLVFLVCFFWFVGYAGKNGLLEKLGSFHGFHKAEEKRLPEKSHEGGKKQRVARKEIYRGFSIKRIYRNGHYLYYEEKNGLYTKSLRDMHLAINSIIFRKTTKIRDVALERIYAKADSDGDGYLTWKEIKSFQAWLWGNYRYENNLTALRPDQFIAAGGGDCEDWALMTAGLLEYWGWKAYIGTYRGGGSYYGHAVCMVYWKEKPPGFLSYHVAGRKTYYGHKLPDGYYIPIDYNFVGGLSRAVGRNWYLTGFYLPEEIYGRVL